MHAMQPRVRGTYVIHAVKPEFLGIHAKSIRLTMQHVRNPWMKPWTLLVQMK